MAPRRQRHERTITPELIAETLGTVSDGASAAILASGATVEEFEEAVAWAMGASDVVGELERPLSGRVAAVYEILTKEREEQWQDDATD